MGGDAHKPSYNTLPLISYEVLYRCHMGVQNPLKSRAHDLLPIALHLLDPIALQPSCPLFNACAFDACAWMMDDGSRDGGRWMTDRTFERASALL